MDGLLSTSNSDATKSLQILKFLPKRLDVQGEQNLENGEERVKGDVRHHAWLDLENSPEYVNHHSGSLLKGLRW